jgi:dTDP-4-amino-4,6-dideoxygalactose transaminase
MAVPLLDVNAQNYPLREELNAAFNRCLDHGMFILGKEVETFEGLCRDLLGVKHAIAVSSGTDALLLALMALDLQPGDEVLCPAFTFFATGGAVARLGAVPVFVDVCPVCFNMDAGDAERKLTAKTRAIMPVHLFGQCADMDPLLTLAAKQGLRVVEDAAQSFGALYKGRQSGSMGDFGAYSFFPSKNLGGLGDAGLLATNDDRLGHYARTLRVHGMEPKYYHHFVGANFRIDALQAAFLSVKLARYGGYTALRQANAAYYHGHLAGVAGVELARPEHCKCAAAQAVTLAASGVKVLLPVAYGHNTHIWNQFTLRVLGGRRDGLKDYLQSRKIGCEVYYPVTLDEQRCFASLPEHARVGCEVARQLKDEVLSIPIYPELTLDQKAEVVGAIAEWVGEV